MRERNRSVNLSKPRDHLSLAQARRLAIAAHGLAGQSSLPTNKRRVLATIRQLGLLQIDSVNVLVRAHFMPLFSRLGAYDQQLLSGDAYRGKNRPLFEYWAHEACLIPVEMHRLFRWRMAAAERGEGIYSGLARFAAENRALINQVLAAVRDSGAMAASGLSLGSQGVPGWWGWSDAKSALEYLFWAGKLTTLRRETAGFARIYDLPERVLSGDILNVTTPEPAEAQRQLLLHAARAHGIATATDLREYFRLPVTETALRLAELVEAGELLPVSVDGWNNPAFVPPGLTVPRRVDAAALLSPFDPLISERRRAERLFGFHYRIEIYTPAHKRRFGYYCLPFLLGDRIVARLDLKAERSSLTLRVESAHLEDGAAAYEVGPPARQELERMAAWLGLDHVHVEGRSALAKVLREA